jgi:hypothetical protein
LVILLISAVLLRLCAAVRLREALSPSVRLIEEIVAILLRASKLACTFAAVSVTAMA